MTQFYSRDKSLVSVSMSVMRLYLLNENRKTVDTYNVHIMRFHKENNNFKKDFKSISEKVSCVSLVLVPNPTRAGPTGACPAFY